MYQQTEILTLKLKTMTIQDLKNLDLYKCSLQDINRANKALDRCVQNLIDNGCATANNYHGTNRYNEVNKLRVLVARARRGMTPQGAMIDHNTNRDRLPNSKSTL